MNERKKILWLASWYPNKQDPFDGDFIQRHARAAAILHDIHVIFVKDADDGPVLEEQLDQATGLTEQVIYFKRPAGILARWRKQFIWRSLFQSAIKKYIDQHGKPAGVHVQVPWKCGLMAVWMKKEFGLPFLVTEHWGNYLEEDAGSFASQPALIRGLLKKIYKESLVTITVSRYLAAQIRKFTGLTTGMVLPNVVDTTLFHYRSEKYSKFTFIHVSNMAAWKNVDGIIEAFAEFITTVDKNVVQLLLIGNRNDQFIQYARNSGLLNASIFFLGEMSYQEVAQEVKRSHCHVLFGNRETFSCVTAEALCAGLPVIVPRAGALPELVDQNQGILIDPDNKRELAGAMKRVYENYGSFDHQLIAKEAAGKYSYAAISEQFKLLYEGLD